MPSDPLSPPKPSEKGILARFAHLLSAQLVEGGASAALFFYLARQDKTVFGEVMYAVAAGAVLAKVVQFGLYYPLVPLLGRADEDSKPELLNRANLIKSALFALSMLTVGGMVLFRGFPWQPALVVVVVCLGFGLDAIAETFFADLRVKGWQDKEARIKIIGSALGYGYGLGAAVLGLEPVWISLFQVVISSVRLGFGIFYYLKIYASRVLAPPACPAVWSLFRAALIFALIEILGIVYNKTNVFFLESSTGVEGVAVYSATWNIVDPISIVVSEQFLGWVIFPLLASLWWIARDRAGRLVRRNAQWLMAVAFPIMFMLHTESALIIGWIYGSEYSDSIWMQQTLVWTILLSFENNLFQYVMMVAGAAKTLLLFTAVAVIFNLLFNQTLVPALGLMGGCLVIILTKLVMTVQTFTYCQIRFRFFNWWDFLFPTALATASVLLFIATKPLIGLHPAVGLTMALYALVIWRLGTKFLGRLPSRGRADSN